VAGSRALGVGVVTTRLATIGRQGYGLGMGLAGDLDARRGVPGWWWILPMRGPAW